MRRRFGAIAGLALSIALGACGARTAATPVTAGCYHAEHSIIYPLGASSRLPDTVAGAWLELHSDTLPDTRHRRKATAFDRLGNIQTGHWQWADDRLLLDLHDGFTSTHVELRATGDSLVGEGSAVTDVIDRNGMATREHWTSVLHAMRCADRPALTRTSWKRDAEDSLREHSR